MTFRKYRIGELGKVVTGKTPSTKRPDYWGGEFPFITIPDLNNLPYVEQTERTLSQLGAMAIKGQILPENSVLMSCIATVGKCGLTTRPSITNQQINAVIPNDKVDPLFLLYLFRNLGAEMARYGGGGTVYSNISKSLFESIEVEIPESLLAQSAISKILASLDAKIASNNLLSRILEDIAQTIFKSWFIDFDPVKAKMAGEKPEGMDDATASLFPDLMVESELGLIPDGWKVGQLNSILKLNKSTVKAGPLTESVPYVPIDQIGAKDIFLKNSLSGSEAKTSLVSFKKDDVLFGAMRPYFHKVALAPFNGTTRTTTFVLRAINPDYLAYSLFAVYQDEAVAYATNNSQGTTIPYAIWKNSFENYPIALPPERIAKAFNDLIIPIITFGYSLIAQNQTLVAIRDEFLPRLISGQLQIPAEMLAT